MLLTVAKHTDSKQKTRMQSATDAAPVVFIAAMANTTHRPRYTVSMYRGLNAFIIISPVAMNRFAAYRPCATASKSAVLLISQHHHLLRTENIQDIAEE